ncbi:MAG: hypothetical protein HYV99_01380, partial [Betaproteobacteria bacterium]|nr:hypothetical protein [Betaproteobacteria bacterium]
AATLLPAIGFHYVGEEAIFPISSLEMWYHGEWVQQRFLGANLQHNPLFNWLIIALTGAAGWEHVLAVTRAITIAATVGMGLVLAWLCTALYRDTVFAAFAALVYLTLADVFFYRGWLAYADPLFAFFLFAAMACLWVACARRSASLLALAVAALTCGFMTKALTAYAFYGGAALPDNTGQAGRMFDEILAKLAPAGLADYALKLVTYAFYTAVRLSPALLLAAYFSWQGRGSGVKFVDDCCRTALWMALINYLPYWLAPQSSSRYLMPLYPLAGLVIARLLWSAGAQAISVTQRWLVAAVAVKLVIVLAAFPYYQAHYRGANYATAAREILKRASGHPLYTTNDSASGLSVAAHIDVLRLPDPPLTFPPAQGESGFVITYAPDPKLGKIAADFRLGGNNLYLLCRGAACPK